MKGVLATWQARRIADRKDVAIFTDEAAAMAWLFDEKADLAAA